jgi:mono/diheme cytochrome c family protein
MEGLVSSAVADPIWRAALTRFLATVDPQRHELRSVDADATGGGYVLTFQGKANFDISVARTMFSGVFLATSESLKFLNLRGFIAYSAEYVRLYGVPVAEDSRVELQATFLHLYDEIYSSSIKDQVTRYVCCVFENKNSVMDAMAKATDAQLKTVITFIKTITVAYHPAFPADEDAVTDVTELHARVCRLRVDLNDDDQEAFVSTAYRNGDNVSKVTDLAQLRQSIKLLRRLIELKHGASDGDDGDDRIRLQATFARRYSRINRVRNRAIVTDYIRAAMQDSGNRSGNAIMATATDAQLKSIVAFMRTLSAAPATFPADEDAVADLTELHARICRMGDDLDNRDHVAFVSAAYHDGGKSVHKITDLTQLRQSIKLLRRLLELKHAGRI